jgi:hypothetical protein
MFCHFIHDGKERDNEVVLGNIRADIDTLMRTPPINLAWGDRSNDADINDYEDMCYGCHGVEAIVGNGCNNGSLLIWENDLHTHPFASAPDPNNPPSRIIEIGGAFPLSDGPDPARDTLDDYGTQTGTIYCGTCHNVHDGRVQPYLNHEPEDLNISPYVANSFCEYCHDAESSRFQFVHNSHPIDAGPNPPATISRWPLLYYSGGSGCAGGVTSDDTESGHIICLTCHNIHAAATNWKGGSASDPNRNEHGKLLVIDNKSSDQGSDMCQDCHQFNHES